MEDDVRLNNDDGDDDDDDPDGAASASVSLSRARKCVSSPPEREQLRNASFQELAQNMKKTRILEFRTQFRQKNMNY